MTWRITHRSTRVGSDEEVLGWKLSYNLFFEQIASVARTVNKFFFERIVRAIRTDNNIIFSNGYPKPFERMTTFFKRTAQAIRTDDNFFQMDSPSRSNG